MSPLFGKHHDADAEGETDPPETDWRKLPRLAELGPELDAAAREAASMPLPQLAAKLMTELFGTEYQPRGNGVDVDSIAGPLIPEHGPPKAGDKNPPGARTLWDLAAEAIQLLEQARLIVPDLWYSGNVACFGYRSTRAGRAALEQGTVEQLAAALLG
jgi:hypothetical protein